MLRSRRSVRYTLILAGAALGTALAAIGGWRYARASAPLNGPIIVISIGTLRADHLSVYGYQKTKTPAIDHLAADGVVFDRAYSHAPLTLPAQVAILSGRLPFDTGVRDDAGFTLKTGERLLPQMLRERGYTTAGVMSSHLLRKDTGISQGFDFFDADVPPALPGQAMSDLRRDGSESERIAERWLDSVGTSRAFLFMHLAEPHQPYAPPERFSAYPPYDGAIAYADEIVGRLVHYLKSHQLYDRSTIVLLSDHGEGLGDHGDAEHGVFLYDEAIHIPFIIKQESNLAAGRRVADPVQQVDLVPTILDLVKAPVPGALRGQSLKALLEGSGHLAERAIYSEAIHAKYEFGWSDLIALTDGRYRYIKAPQEELYDLERDPHETANLADEKVDVRQRLQGRLETLTAGSTSPAPGGDAVRADPKDRRRTLAMYRQAMALARDRKWPQAIVALQRILRDEPTTVSLWNQLAFFAASADRVDLVVNAYQRIAELRPSDPEPRLGLADAFLKMKKLDEARTQAELASENAPEDDAGGRRAAHELLVRIALARPDADQARLEAEIVRQIDRTSPMAAYVDARVLYDAGRYEEALPVFEQTIAGLKKLAGAQIPELHFYAADTLMRLGRYSQAEAEFIEELRYSPQSTRTRVGLATLYQTTGRADDAAQVVADMTRLSPTADSYAAAARFWKSLGNTRQADAVRAEARRTRAEQASVLPRR